MSERLGAFTAAILQDGRLRSAVELESLATEIGARLMGGPRGRLAVVGTHADVVAVGLRACEKAGWEILLLRSAVSSMQGTPGQASANVVLKEDFTLEEKDGPSVSPDSFAVLLTTSGTTGQPKLVRYDPDHLLGRVRTPKAGSSGSRWLLTYAPASFAGLQVLLTCLSGGSTLVASSTPSTRELAECALRHRATHISATPTFWRAFLVALGDASRELQLEQATLGGEAIDQSILERLTAAFPRAVITQIYASTEAGALFAVHDGLAGFPARWLREGIEGVQLRIRNGVLEVKSPRGMEGYVSQQGGLDHQDSWIVTNDLVEQRGARVHFKGRVDSVINVGGAKVSPEEVESVLLEVPGVVEVHVFGRANPISGALVAARVVCAAGWDHQEVRKAIARNARAVLDVHKVPRIIEFVESLAISETGKKSR